MSDYNWNNEADNNESNSKPKASGLAIAALVLGIVGLAAWCLPCLGYIVTIVGIILGILGIRETQKDKGGKGMAIAGVVLCAILREYQLLRKTKFAWTAGLVFFFYAVNPIIGS